MTRSTKAKLCTSLLGVVATLCLLLATEVSMRASKGIWGPNVESRNQFTSEQPADLPVYLEPQREWPLPRLTAEVQRIRWRPGPVLRKEDNNYHFREPAYGYRAIPNRRSHVDAFTPGGERIYSVDYAFDHAGRRDIGPIDTTRAPILFLGGSITLGEGVAGAETFAAAFRRGQTRFQPYVYAFHGWGPAHLLKFINSSAFSVDLPTNRQEEGMVVYTYIDHHINRTIGSSELATTGREWLKSIPHYTLNSTGVETEGTQYETRPTLLNFYFLYHTLISSSLLLGSFFPDLPIFTDRHYDLIVGIIAEIKRSVAKQTQIPKFKVMIFPESVTAKWIVPRLRARSIDVLDYSTLKLEDYVRQPRFINDSHPTAETHALLGKLLVQDLTE